MLISSFDPWRHRLCTCPRKYSFSPYTGCSHACQYCYITSYIPRAFQARVKNNVIARLHKEVHARDDIKDAYISMANSSDPYTPEERHARVTRKTLKVFRDHDIPVLIVTKSDLVTRDIDVLSSMSAAVSMSVTSLDNDTMRTLEPHAPRAEKRIDALRQLSDHGIPCAVRLDPVIPHVNDHEIDAIVRMVAPYCRHIVSSTLKPRRDGLRRLESTLPDALQHMHFEKEGNTYYLPAAQRATLMKKVETICQRHELSFASCREFGVNTATCDGSQLLPR